MTTIMQKRLNAWTKENSDMIAELRRIKKYASKHNGKVCPSDLIKYMQLWDVLERRGINIDEVLS